MASLPPAEAHARRVLQQFARNCLATYQLRCELRSRRALAVAFHKAALMSPSTSIPAANTSVRRSVDPTSLQNRRQQLVRRYSASLVRPPSPIHEPIEEEVLVTKSVYTGKSRRDDQPVRLHSESSDEERGREPQQQQHHVTFELVVQCLHAQLEHLREESAAKDRRIRELETLVARLESDNVDLSHHAYRASSKSAPLGSARPAVSNQQQTT